MPVSRGFSLYTMRRGGAGLEIAKHLQFFRTRRLGAVAAIGKLNLPAGAGGDGFAGYTGVNAGDHKFARDRVRAQDAEISDHGNRTFAAETGPLARFAAGKKPDGGDEVEFFDKRAAGLLDNDQDLLR